MRTIPLFGAVFLWILPSAHVAGSYIYEVQIVLATSSLSKIILCYPYFSGPSMNQILATHWPLCTNLVFYNLQTYNTQLHPKSDKCELRELRRCPAALQSNGGSHSELCAVYLLYRIPTFQCPLPSPHLTHPLLICRELPISSDDTSVLYQYSCY